MVMGQANDNLHVPVNTTDDVLLQPSWHVLYLAACVSLIFFTVLSNSLTIFAVFHMKKLRYSVSNCYIASLSLADLFVGLFGMTFMTVNMVIYDERWGLPSVLCDLWRGIVYTSFTITLYNVCAIAFDCWLTLEKPLGILRRRKHIAKVMIISIWLFPLAFWSITIVVLRVFSGDLVSSAHSCNVNWKPKFLVFIVMSVLFYLPVLMLIYIFIRIILLINTHLIFLNEHSNQCTSDFYAFMKPSANNCRCAKWMYAKKTIELESTPFKQQLLPVDSTAGKAKFEICCTDDEELVDSQENASSAVTANSPRDVITQSRSSGFVGSEQLRQQKNRQSFSKNNQSRNTNWHLKCPLRQKCHRGGSYLHKNPSSDSLRNINMRNKRSYSCVELTHLRQSIPSKCNNILLSYKESVTALSEFLNRKIKCQMKATRAVGVILLIFLLTWLPILIVWPLKVYCNDCISNSVFRWATWMNYINSAINPLIYSWNCPRFQRVFKEKICTKIKCL